MTRHQKRLSVPKSWPVERKTAVFTVKATAGPHGEEGVPLLVVLRDVLGYVDSRKEARYALEQDGVLINGVAVSDERRPVGMFDIVAFPERNEHYRVFPDEGGRLALHPIDEEAADSRLGKVAGKRQVGGGVTQLSLHDGSTLTLEDPEYETTDSIVVDNEDSSVVAHFPFEEGALVTAVRGNHAGKIGTIDEIEITPGSGPNVVRVGGDDPFETIQEYVFVIDEHFVDEDTDDDSVEDDAPADAESTADSTDEDADDDAESTAESEDEDADEGGEDE